MLLEGLLEGFFPDSFHVKKKKNKNNKNGNLGE